MRSQNKWVLNFCRGFLAAILFYVLYNGLLTDQSGLSPAAWGRFWLGPFLSPGVLWSVLEGAHWYLKRTRFGHLPAVFWALGTALGGIDFGANTFSLFEIQNFDKIVHFSTGILGTVLFLNLIRVISRFYQYNIPRMVVYYVTLTTANLFSVIYEIAELIGDRYYGAHNVTGPFDTSSDLLVNNLGIILVLAADFAISIIRKQIK